jgi:MFS family permease
VLNWFAKFLLVATSLSPILGAVAVNQLAQNKPWYQWSAWLGAALALALLCAVVLGYARKNVETQNFAIKEFERSDHEVVAFLIAYLLPFVSAKDLAFSGEWLTGAYILCIIFLVVSHAGAFHFNPVMGLLRYHFYAVKNSDGVSHLLISKVELKKPGTEITVVKLARNIYLHKEA